jgi:nucleoside 2-deoxyribosyltransferase
LIVANLDGHDVDAGTAWEIGYAVAKGKTVFGVRTDRRVLEPFASVNLMIGHSVTVVPSIPILCARLRCFTLERPKP